MPKAAVVCSLFIPFKILCMACGTRGERAKQQIEFYSIEPLGYVLFSQQQQQHHQKYSLHSKTAKAELCVFECDTKGNGSASQKTHRHNVVNTCSTSIYVN